MRKQFAAFSVFREMDSQIRLSFFDSIQSEKKLRQIAQENSTADFLLNNGAKILIKRARFEEFLNETSSI